MENTTLDMWAIVEVMGHLKYAGRVTEQEIAGVKMLRVDVPALEEATIPSAYSHPGRTYPAQAGFTTFIGASALFKLTPVTEDVVRAAVRQCDLPVNIYMPELGTGARLLVAAEGSDPFAEI